jgi:hypothetical protein
MARFKPSHAKPVTNPPAPSWEANSVLQSEGKQLGAVVEGIGVAF